MTTAADWIEEVKSHIYAGQRPVMNKLTASVAADANVTTLAFAHAMTGLTTGSLISAGLETMYVWTSDTTSKTAVVQRAYNGSTLSAHTTSELLTINPRVTDAEIFRALNYELNALAKEGVYRLRTLDRTFSAPVLGYDLASDLLEEDVVEVSWRDNSSSLDYYKVREYRVLRNLPTTDFPSGNGLFVHDDVQQGRPLRVTYKATLGQLSALTDNVTITGLPTSATDIPPIGAAIRLFAAKPMRRAAVEVQGDTRRPAEASTSDTLSAPNALRALYQRRVAEESAVLAGQNPYLRRR